MLLCTDFFFFLEVDGRYLISGARGPTPFGSHARRSEKIVSYGLPAVGAFPLPEQSAPERVRTRNNAPPEKCCTEKIMRHQHHLPKSS